MLVKTNTKQDVPMAPTKITKEGVRLIQYMSTPRILWFITKRHKVGLLITSTIVGFTYDNLIPFVAREAFALLFN